MAVRFDGGSGDSFSRTANYPSTTAYTACGWAKLSVDTNSYAAVFSLDNGGTNYHVIETDSDGTSLKLFFGGSSSGSVSLATLTTGQWFFWAVSNSGTGAGNNVAYYALPNATGLTSASAVGTSFTPSGMYLGNDGFNEPFNGCIANVKIWDAVLTADELFAEMHAAVPLRKANLHLWTPMHRSSVADSALDLSGAAKNWTVNGTMAVEDGPPVPWGGRVLLVGKAAAGGPATITGTGALQADAATIAGTAEREHTATGALAAQAATIAGTAERAVKGTGALAAQAATVAGTAERAVTGTGALAAAAATIAGTAERVITGTGALASAAATVEGTAERSVIGTGALSSQDATIAGTGAVGDVIVGSGALEAQAATVEGTAERTVTGTGSLTAQTATVEGTAERAVTGTGALTAAAATVAGVAVRVITGTGALSAQAATIAGDGSVVTSGTVAGSGALAANDATIAGSGDVIHIAKSAAAGGKRKRAKPRRILEEAELTPEQREALGLPPVEAPQPKAAPKPPKRAKRTGRRGIQLQPDDEAQEAAAGLAQRTAELIAAAARAQEAQNAAALAAAREAQAMLEAAVAIEAENEMIMLLLMAA